VAILVAMAVNEEGEREVLGACEGMKEDTESWLNFLRDLKARGLHGTQLFIGDKNLGRTHGLSYSTLPTMYGALLSQCDVGCASE
jgi:putative transposase